jgi:hypothetical protein
MRLPFFRRRTKPVVALARAGHRQVGPRYAAGAHANRVTDGNTRACYGAVRRGECRRRGTT